MTDGRQNKLLRSVTQTLFPFATAMAITSSPIVIEVNSSKGRCRGWLEYAWASAVGGKGKVVKINIRPYIQVKASVALIFMNTYD